MSDPTHPEQEKHGRKGNENDPDGSRQEPNELEARFLAITAHEFKTPLTGILSSLYLIDRYLESDAANWARFKHHEKVASHLGKVRESALNLSSTLNRFLSVRNIEQENIPLKLKVIDLKAALEEQAAQMQIVAKEKQRITHRHTGTMTSATTDKYMLRNIMNNLLSNAIKFSPAGSEISLNSSVTPDSIKIELKDQGVGIPPAEQEKIFRQYYRAGNTSISEEGTGLGLFIVKRYIDRLGGTIELESKVNEGTTVIITLPNHSAHEEDPGD